MHPDHRVGVMDRVISLLAALVGLIALGGAVLVHTNADTQRRELATDIAQLKASVSLLGHDPAPSIPPIAMASSEPPAAVSSSQPAPLQPATDETAAKTLQAMQDRLASLEQQTRDQASALAEAETKLAAAESKLSSMPPAAPATEVATATPAALTPEASSSVAPPVSSATPAAVTAGGPTTDCIPIGTRFMAAAGDNFPICKTKQVIKVAAVSDGIATIVGPGDVTAGATVALAQGCTISVFSADISGYAEMRVSCE